MAVDAVGGGLLGDARAGMAAFLIGLLATFLFVRINTRLIRAQVSWWFHDIESEGGTHVHHMVIGVVLMVVTGILMIATGAVGLLEQAIALVFGVGVALTLDEFALILNLQDVYWRKEGRLSVDAVIIVVTAAALFVLGLNPFGDLGDPGLSGDLLRMAVTAYLTVIIVPVVLCLLKGKIWTGMVGMFVPFVAIAGAVRIARLNSPWARRRYPKKAKKLAKAQRREARLNARWIAWRDAFFDLIAGKPHLPSLPSLGPNGMPANIGSTAEAATAETASAAPARATAADDDPEADSAG